jgi:T-complex protein 1 subunit alpha
MSSKIIGPDSEFFANMCVDAITKVKTVSTKGLEKYPVKSINVLKAHGKSAKESLLIDGYALNCTVAAAGMPLIVKNAKIALLDINLQKQRMNLGVNIVIKDPKQIEEVKQRESDLVKEKIQLILKSGANVVLTTKGIDDLCLKYFVEAGAMAVRRCKKEDLRRIAKSTGGTVVTTLASSEESDAEIFDASNLGFADQVSQERVADDELIIIKVNFILSFFFIFKMMIQLPVLSIIIYS